MKSGRPGKWPVFIPGLMAVCGACVAYQHEPHGKVAALLHRTSARPQLAKVGCDPTKMLFDVACEEDLVHRDARLRALAERAAQDKPEVALGSALGLPSGEIRDMFIRELCQAWARRNPEESLAWSEHLDKPVGQRIRSIICLEIALSDSRRALELAIKHGADKGQDGLLENLTVQWADSEPVAALDWVKDQEGSEWNDRLVARVAFVLSKSDPRSAACWVTEHMAAGPEQTEAILSVLNQWRLIDPGEAAAWAESFPSGPLRERALNELAGCLLSE